MKKALVSLAAGASVVVFLQWMTPDAQATLKYRKETDRKCLFCHTAIPKRGAEDPLLSEDGKKFKENDYKLTDEQKRKPDPE
ncbi:MAG: hypothetical protein ACR2L2_11550 [Acidobacteriota bacterium]